MKRRKPNKKDPARKATVGPGRTQSAPPAAPFPATEPAEAGAGEGTPGASDKLKNLPAKWGAEAIKAGWVALPSVILERQDALGLDAIDINIILHIAKHWFEPANLPHPSKGSIARAMQLSPRTIQKHISRLHDLGFITRIERRGPKGSRGSQTSKFDFTGLVDKTRPFAIEALNQREENRARRLEQLGRKRPQIPTKEKAA